MHSSKPTQQSDINDNFSFQIIASTSFYKYLFMVSLGSVGKDQHHCLKSTVNISVQVKLETMESLETMKSTLARQRIRSTFIRDLICFQMISKMKARVSRLWRPKKYKSDKNDGVHYVLVDEKGDAIHAVIDEKDYPHVKKKMEEGHVYEIFQFHTKDDTSNYKVIDRRPQICFNRRTEFFEVEDTFPPIPRHAFLLLEFDQLKAAMENQKVLIDLYGCLKSVVPEYQVAIKNENRMESKCEVILENLRREDVGIALWGHTAKRFDVEAIQKHPAPLLIVFTSLKIGLFQDRISPSTTQHTCFIIDPSIPQREEYMKEFSKPGDKVKVIPNSFRSPTPEEVKDSKKMSVSNLNTLNPKSYTTKMVYCAAWICRFSTENNWWYKGCPSCYKLLRQKENSDHFSCTEHDVQIPLPCYRLYMTIEDVGNEATVVLIGKQAEHIFGAPCQELVTKRLYPDEETLPEEIENTIGQKYVFLLKVKRNGELIVRGVYPDPQDSLPSTELGPMTTTTDYPPSQKEEVIETAEKPLHVFTSAKRLKREAQHQTATSSSINDQQT